MPSIRLQIGSKYEMNRMKDVFAENRDSRFMKEFIFYDPFNCISNLRRKVYSSSFYVVDYDVG